MQYLIVTFIKEGTLKIVREENKLEKAKDFIESSGSYRNIYYIVEKVDYVDPLSKLKKDRFKCN